MYNHQPLRKLKIINDLIITLIQTDLEWENIDANLSLFDKKIDLAPDDTHLIVLPEMFTTGFSMKSHSLFEDMSGHTISWLKEKSRQKNVDIAGSAIIKERQNYYNRLLWVKPGGDVFSYDKCHLFPLAGEDKVFTPGKNNITIELNGWRIRPFICYDLRFPGWIRNRDYVYDIALFVANWPEKRSLHWKTLLLARAIENHCYIIGVNRIGSDEMGSTYSGDSSIISPKGDILFQKAFDICVHTSKLSYQTLKEYRKSFPMGTGILKNHGI